MRWRVLSVLLALAPLGAHAAGGTNQAVGQAIWNAATKGKTTTVAPGGKITTIAPAGSGGTPIGQVTTAGNTSSGGVAIAGSGTAPVNGKGVPVTTSGTISKESVANGVAAVVCAVGTGGACAVAAAAAVAMPFAMNWLANAGVSRNAQTGALEEVNKDGAVQSDGYQWYTSLSQAMGPAYSAEHACAKLYDWGMVNWWGPQATVTYQKIGGGTYGSCSYAVTRNGQSWTDVYALERYGNSDCPAGYYATPFGCYSSGNLPRVAVGGGRLVDLLVSKGGAPDPGVVNEITTQGGTVTAGDISVSGPTSVPGPTTINITNTSNGPVTTTTTTTNNYTYNGNSVTNTGTTTNKEVKDKDGNTVSTEQETTSPGDEETSPQDSPVDTPLGPIPKLYERKYPNGMEGIWNDYSGQIKQSSMFTFAAKLMPNIGDGGSCPSWMLSFNWNSWIQYGTHDVAPPCWIWDVARAIIIFSALLLARALIFGG